jgi:hypothetical protein
MVGEGAFPCSRRAGDADAARPDTADPLVDVGHHSLEAVPLVFDEADGPGEGSGVAAVEAVRESVVPHLSAKIAPTFARWNVRRAGVALSQTDRES